MRLTDINHVVREKKTRPTQMTRKITYFVAERAAKGIHYSLSNEKIGILVVCRLDN